jgi:Mn-containing catalase
VDPGLHHLQGKAKRVKATELLDFLREFHREKLAMLRRHQASARLVSDYDFNNTYQYVIAREEMHVSWVRDAILDVSGQIDAPAAGQAEDPAEPSIQTSGKGAQATVMAQDREAEARALPTGRGQRSEP